MTFDSSKYKIYTWKHWMIFHWMLNPGLAINELILGQRVPKIALEDKTVNKPRAERSIVPCPHCQTMHDGRTWSHHNGTAFKNWFGFYCPACGGIIPCVMNVVTFLILAITFPVWGWFKNSIKASWLKQQPARYQNINIEKVPNIYDNKAWIEVGLGWGGFMFIIMSLIYPFVMGQIMTWYTILIGLVIWSIGGLGFGYTMKLIMGTRPQNKQDEAS